MAKISEQVRFARRRFGHYEVIDFLAVLFGYAISGERTLEKFYEHLQPFAVPFMALFERDQLPSRSALSRFLAALTSEPVEALRTLFLDDLLNRPMVPEKQTGNLVDLAGNAWIVFDIDGTRESAHQRALPQTEELPSPFRLLDDVCAPGYRGRKRGQVVRTRTVVSQAHCFQWLGSFGNRGNGRYREELRAARAAITRYLTAHQPPSERAPLLWHDWSRRAHRRACMQLVRHQRIEVSLLPAAAALPGKAEVLLSRAQRTHSPTGCATRCAPGSNGFRRRFGDVPASVLERRPRG